MAKKKTLKKVAITASFFSMHRHARWLLILFILASILFLFLSNRGDQQQKTEINHLLIQATDDTISWKTYTNPVGKFSIQYPANWKIVEAHETRQGSIDDLKEINTATLTGGNGEVVLEWGGVSPVGGCSMHDQVMLKIKGMRIPVCKTITNGMTMWNHIYPAGHTPSFAAHAEAFDNESADVVKSIFSTLSFTK